MAPVDVSALLKGVSAISVHVDLTGAISEDELSEICKQGLDVIFNFSVRDLQGGIFRAAHHGVWSFHHGDNMEYRGGPPLFWEMFERNPVSGSILQIHTEPRDCGRVIYRSYASTDQTSLYRNRNPVYWKTAEFALRRLRDLHLHGIEYIHSLPTYCEQETFPRVTHSTPNSLQMTLFLMRHLFHSVQSRAASQWPGFRTKWYIAIRRRTTQHGFDNSFGYGLMLSPRNRFYADPFLAEKNGQTYLFFEDYRYAEGRAFISCCELGPDGTPGLPFEALRRPYHLSYPFVFEHEGEMYMIPETRQERTVELYRATSFPAAWTAETVLIRDIDAVDATIQKIDGKFWMFAGVSNGKYSNCDELNLFFTDVLTGPWTPHPCNPVLSDVRRARPAGALFYDRGRLIRPSQDCGKAYGYALVFSEVVTLSETQYEERLVSRLDPDSAQGILAIHTYNRTEQFEVIDKTLREQVPGWQDG
jgi:hypothetical protein